MSKLSLQPYKGARDFYPEDKRKQKYMFGVIRRVVESFGYQEYDAPMIEPFDIYAAKTGEEIVNQQLYSFEDRGGRKVAIRPEMTPSVSRMVAAKRQELAYPLRWYSIPNLWRYERPQRGRLREHWQLNVDVFGIEGAEAETELIQIADSVLRAFGANESMYEIRINSRLFLEERVTNAGVKTSLTDVVRLVDAYEKLSREEFDSRMREHVENPDELYSFFENSDPTEQIKKIIEHLNSLGMNNVKFVPTLARGFEYYTDIVFEVFDTNPDNNRSMFGGGRYDGLVGAFGVEPVPTVGFGMGDVTLQNFLESNNLLPNLSPETQVTFILIGDVYDAAQNYVQTLREAGINVSVDPTSRKIDSKIKNAFKAGVENVVFAGEKEIENKKFMLKNLKSGTEEELSIEDISARFAK